MKFRDLNPNTMPGPGDRETYGYRSNDPQNACDCDDGCIRCDPDLRAEAEAERDYEPYDDGRWD